MLAQLQPINLTLGRVAQSVEQRIENPRVTGSIPVPATKNLPHQKYKCLVHQH